MSFQVAAGPDQKQIHGIAPIEMIDLVASQSVPGGKCPRQKQVVDGGGQVAATPALEGQYFP